MKSAGKARNNGLYRHIRTSKEIIRNLLNDSSNNSKSSTDFPHLRMPVMTLISPFHILRMSRSR